MPCSGCFRAFHSLAAAPGGRAKKNKEKEFARDVRKEARALAKAGERKAAGKEGVEEGVGREKVRAAGSELDGLY